MTIIDQSEIVGKIRDRPIARELEQVLRAAGEAAGIDRVVVSSGGQPGTRGGRKGSTRHDGGRAADLRLIADRRTLRFSDRKPDEQLRRFVVAAAANGAIGIGAGVGYMGDSTLHVGFGRNRRDTQRLVWGAGGASRNAPDWLRRAAEEGWRNPPDWAFPDGRDTEPGEAESEDERDAERDDAEEAGRDVGNGRFPPDVIRAAQKSQERWRIPASVCLAQWALESGFGAHMPPNSNNPFGIKATRGQAGVGSMTTEVVGGGRVRERARFRVFASLDDAFDAHGRLLATGSAYAACRQFLNDPERFADSLTGIYATDPRYGAKLRAIMRDNKLHVFDMLVPVQVEEEPAELDETTVRAVQERLTELGYKLGLIDGIFGTLTKSALLEFQSENGLPTTGFPDAATRAQLSRAQPRQLSNRRVTATEESLIQDGSTVARNARNGRVLGWITAAFGALGVGNSAIVNSPMNAGDAGVDLPAILETLRNLPPTADPAAQAAQISQALAQIAPLLPPDGQSARVLDLLRLALTSSDPALASDSLARLLSAPEAAPLRTVFDMLPGFFSDGSVLQTVTQGIAGLSGSLLPNFAGSLVMVAIGLFGRQLSNRISAARVEDQRTAGNLNPLGTAPRPRPA